MRLRSGEWIPVGLFIGMIGFFVGLQSYTMTAASPVEAKTLENQIRHDLSKVLKGAPHRSLTDILIYVRELSSSENSQPTRILCDTLFELNVDDLRRFSTELRTDHAADLPCQKILLSRLDEKKTCSKHPLSEDGDLKKECR